MFVKWKHKSFSKGSRLQGLCLFLVGAVFNSIFFNRFLGVIA